MTPTHSSPFPLLFNPFSDQQTVEEYLQQQFGQMQQNWLLTTRDMMQRYQLFLEESHNLQRSFLARYLEWVRSWPVGLAERLPSEVSDAAPQARVEPDRAVSAKDDLTRIQGLGKVLQQRLYDAGVVSYRQIADWSEADIARIEQEVLGNRFTGRVARDQWQAQAEELLSGA